MVELGVLQLTLKYKGGRRAKREIAVSEKEFEESCSESVSSREHPAGIEKWKQSEILVGSVKDRIVSHNICL